MIYEPVSECPAKAFFMIISILIFLIIFSVIVISHEFGHYAIARRNGIRVIEFDIGMGPVLYRKKGEETDLCIRLLPIGGACIFEGLTDTGMDVSENEEDNTELKQDNAPKPGSFNAAPVWARIAAVFAGPLFNVILAFFLGLFIVWVCGSDLPTVAKIAEGLPAEAAGIQAGDEIISIDGHRTYIWRDIMVRSALNTGAPMKIVYERNGERFETVINPAWSETDKRYYIGFSGGAEHVDCRNLKVFKYSWFEVRYWLDATIQSLKYMVTGHATADDLSGPVGIANVIDDTIEDTKKDGAFWVVVNMVNIALLLSVNLGVMNLLPLPALDMIGFILLMILMVFVLYNDITRFFR